MDIFPAAHLQVISKTEIHSTIVCHLASHTVNPFVVQWIWAIGRKKPEKYQGFNWIRTRDLRDTGAMPDQLSCEATHWEGGQFVELISSRAVKWCEIYMKFILYCSCRWKWEMIIAVNFPMQAIGKKKPEKYQGFNGIRTRGLRDTAAMLDLLSCEATHWWHNEMVWNNYNEILYCGCKWKWRMIIAVNFPI